MHMAPHHEETFDRYPDACDAARAFFALLYKQVGIGEVASVVEAGFAEFLSRNHVTAAQDEHGRAEVVLYAKGEPFTPLLLRVPGR